MPQSGRLLSASSLSGTSIKNALGENLGSIEELMIDVDQNEIAYAVVTFGGFLGMGNKLFAVPWQAVTVDRTNECIRLDIDKEQFDVASGFDKDSWPDMANPAWANAIHQQFGTTPNWQ